MCQKPLGSKKKSKSTKAKPVLAPGALGACPALDPFPYPHVRAPPGLFDRRALLAVREELASLQRTFKETDLFKVYQTGDLANLDPADPRHAAALPRTMALRSALYSSEFRAWVRQLTGCTELTDQTDCSCNVYGGGGHLLCHDDVIGSRCVSYILYLSRPDEAWEAAHGGALELYEMQEAAEGLPQPCAAPSASLAPEFGSMVLFAVQPGRSFHSVGEAVAKASREPLVRLPAPRKPLRGASAAEAGAAGLWEMVNPSYLAADNLRAIRAQLLAQGVVQLASFLRPDVAAPLLEAAAAADRADRLGAGGPPDYTAGLRGPGGGWSAVGPPHLQRYLRFSAEEGAAPGEEGAAAAAADGDTARAAGERLSEVSSLLGSPPFLWLLRCIAGGTPRAWRAEVRRFRPGLDYTLAHAGQLLGRRRLAAQPVLDATFVAVPPARAGKAARAARLWDSGDVGGFECAVPKDRSKAAAEVYRADDASEGVTSVHAVSNSLVLSLRAPQTMRFVKYVSAAAPGSRWDVAAEYRLEQTSAAQSPQPKKPKARGGAGSAAPAGSGGKRRRREGGAS
ncbi:hypothetical protein EMIHUDRAFT_464476 [Emiliania huxleyi CCMP1516]|uniref:Prolyl 4-hydroxylase alpha subunit domain-containing protein n=3 Tax=Emiliania huxleyi TaxID=2903 RepID=A0A0D3IVQ3_EMIH1|nr:hypothetical protein EMIHUDRAFT_464476 [Emiliania huxleyi CCMP1516]EOD15338.1 hypothetical protein EMIHUDRAFT_464476 [Emiliania huxleyi CCMP1516]|eukprot:XP_005767767.1 hypothetical protein EMIHUDRAFT_464476 [Emiliania huxleyi CCMP1516]